MDIINLFAQSTTYYTTYSTTSDLNESALIAAMSGIFLFLAILGVAAYVFMAICLMKIFRKAGVEAWVAWVPFYNNWKLLEIGGQQGFWAILAIIPIVNIASSVFLYIAMYHIGKKLGKEGIFVLLAIFFPYIWYPWLAFDSSKWQDDASTAPSLHKA